MVVVSNVVRRPDDELVRDLFLPVSLRLWRRRTADQLKAWVTTLE